MAVFRIKKTRDYTVMSNYHLKEKTMSLKAKGLLTVLLSLPDEWDYSIDGIVSICKENESAIKTALDELKQYGYLIVKKKMPNETETGRIEYEYNVFEKPQKQEIEKQGVENQGVVFQVVENQGQLNTNYNSIKELNTNYKTPLPPDGGEAAKNEANALFEQFWEQYPRKVDKKGTERMFGRIKGIDELMPQILAALEKQKKSEQWNKDGGQYIPHPKTWLNQERWNDQNAAPRIGSFGYYSNSSFDPEEAFQNALERSRRAAEKC